MTRFASSLPGAPEPPTGAGLAPADILALGDGEVVLLDQTRLPTEEIDQACASWQEVAQAIKTRNPDVEIDDLVARGWQELHDLCARYIAVGFSKLVLVPPGANTSGF